MESPYFSIIIPALNEEKYISGLLKSLINQTYKEFEVILVDGMSADKTVSVYKKVNRPFSGGYNTIVTKKVFLKLNGFREMNINEDHDFAIRAFKKKIETIILPEPKVIFSLRRFRSEGTLNVLRKYAHAAIYAMLKGPVIYEMFEYRMGGHVHKRRRKKINFVKINTYIKTIEKLENNL